MADVDELFEVPPGEFVAARDALAKRLRAEGDAVAAKAVRALRRPSVAAWAVNSAIRQAPDLADELVAAAASLRQAQRAALDGTGAPGDLREASRRHRSAVGDLAKVATSAAGAGPAVVEKVMATLAATASGEDAAHAVRSGRLVGDLDPSGFGGVIEPGGHQPSSSAEPAGPAARKRPKIPGARTPGRADTAGATRPALAREQEERRSAQLEARAVELEDDAERAEAEASLAEAEHARLDDEATAAELGAKAARAEATEARRAAVEARSVADGARRRAAKARERAGRT